jgi:hypothetical protein
MPFHEMSGYPYASKEHFPNDNASLAYRLNWNDRFETGNPNQSYRFNYQPRQAQPIAPKTTTQ